MKKRSTRLEGVFILEPKIWTDDRGCFFESYQAQRYQELGLPNFVQDNVSYSKYGVIRGLHAQKGEKAQAKLVQVLHGRVLDVVLDIRPNSPTFGRSISVLLSEENHRQLFIPQGLAHGFAVLSPTAVFHYKCDRYYSPGDELTLYYDDPTWNIDWPIKVEDRIVSLKDRQGITAEAFYKMLNKEP